MSRSNTVEVKLDPEEVRQGLQAILGFASWVSRLTPGKRDDQAVVLLRLVVETPGLLELLIGLVQSRRG